MPTIIDSLIVKLGLDSQDVDSKASGVERKLKGIETQADKAEESFKEIAKVAGTFLAVIGGTMAIKKFTLDTIDSSAALGRFAQNLGLSVETISAWGHAAEELGGSAKGIQSTMDMLSRAQTELRLTGQSSLLPYFSALGVAFADTAGKARPVDEILMDLSERFSHMDRTTANNMGRMMQIDQDTMNLLLQGRRELELTIKRQKEHNAVTKAQAEQAAKEQRAIADLKQTWEAFGRSLLSQATPALEGLLSLLQSFGNWVQQNREFIVDFLKSLAIGLGTIALLTMPIDLTAAAVVALAGSIALLWQDYQTWKRGGQSFINWSRWEPEITAATDGIKILTAAVEDFFKWYDKIIGGHGFWKDFGAGMKVIGDALGVNVAADMNSHNAKANAQQIQKYFTDRGWSPAQAAGITANLMAESGGNMRAVGDNGQAFGLAQWHKDRQQAFARQFGHDMQTATLGEQLAFVQYELTQGSEKAAGDALRRATSAAQAGAIVSRQYERPADATGEAARRGNAAQLLAGIKGASSPLAAAGSSTAAAPVSADNSVKTDIQTINVYTQATDANGIARDMGKSMDYLFASQANTGLN